VNVTCTRSELSKKFIDALAEGSTVHVYLNKPDDEGKTLDKSYVKKDGSLLMTKDHIDFNAEFKNKEEYNRFFNSLTLDGCLQHFVMQEYNEATPVRKTQAMKRKIQEELKCFIHQGIVLPDKRDKKNSKLLHPYACFYIRMNENTDVDETVEELEKILFLQVARHSYLQDFRFGIREKTLSSNGIYELIVDKDKNARIQITTYGRTKALHKDLTIRDAIEVIKQRYNNNCDKDL
jgi:hypothetical protein